MAKTENWMQSVVSLNPTLLPQDVFARWWRPCGVTKPEMLFPTRNSPGYYSYGELERRVFNLKLQVIQFKLKAGVSRSFNATNVWEQHPRSHHKGATSMQTHPTVRVGFEYSIAP